MGDVKNGLENGGYDVISEKVNGIKRDSCGEMESNHEYFPVNDTQRSYNSIGIDKTMPDPVKAVGLQFSPFFSFLRFVITSFGKK